MIIPGIVRNTVTERIVARTVTVVMSVLELGCPRPKYIFQLDSVQIMSSDSLQVHQHVLHYVHNHICAGFSVDQTQTVQQYQYDCEVKFTGTLLSSYNPRQNVQIPLSQLEQIDFAHTEALHTQLNIGRLSLQRTNLMPCPPNLFTKFPAAHMTTLWPLSMPTVSCVKTHSFLTSCFARVCPVISACPLVKKSFPTRCRRRARGRPIYIAVLRWLLSRAFSACEHTRFHKSSAPFCDAELQFASRLGRHG